MPVTITPINKAKGSSIVADVEIHPYLLLFSGRLGGIKAKELVQFVERGGSILWAIPQGTDPDREVLSLAKQFGRILPIEPTKITDHFTTITDNDSAKFINAVPSNPFIFSSASKAYKLLGEASGHTLDQSNPLVFPIITAPSTAILQTLNQRETIAYGTDISLASGLQARNDARVVMISTASIFTNEYIENYGGEEAIDLSTKLVLWAFGQLGTIELVNLTHDPVNEAHDFYRINTFVNIKVCIDSVGRRSFGDVKVRKPFLVDDLQAELVLMTPQLRFTLHPDQTTGCHHSGPIRLPSRYGVYKLRIRYQRHGLTHLVYEEDIAVKPIRHNEYPRFLTRAWPYYLAWLSTMAGSLLIFFPFLLKSRLDHTRTKSRY